VKSLEVISVKEDNLKDDLLQHAVCAKLLHLEGEKFVI